MTEAEHIQFERWARQAADTGNEAMAIDLYQTADRIRAGATSWV